LKSGFQLSCLLRGLKPLPVVVPVDACLKACPDTNPAMGRLALLGGTDECVRLHTSIFGQAPSGLSIRHVLGIRWGVGHACQPFGLEGVAMIDGVED
jgi:hypothetical protein